MHKDKFSWPGRSIRHVLPYNGSLKDRLKLKIIILRDMLKSVNTPMQKTDNVTC